MSPRLAMSPRMGSCIPNSLCRRRTNSLRRPWTDPPASTSHVLELQAHTTRHSFCCTGDQTQGRVHSRQSLQQLRCISSPRLTLNTWPQTPGGTVRGEGSNHLIFPMHLSVVLRPPPPPSPVSKTAHSACYPVPEALTDRTILGCSRNQSKWTQPSWVLLSGCFFSTQCFEFIFQSYM